MTIKLSYEEAQRNLKLKEAREASDLEAKHKAEMQDLKDRYRAKFQLLDEIWSEHSDDDRTATSPEEREAAVEVRGNRAIRSNGSSIHMLSGSFGTHSIIAKRSASDEVQSILTELRSELTDDEAARRIITQRTVRERYEARHPGSDSTNLRSRISHTLKELSEGDGPLELVERGAGSEPSKYRLRSRQGEAGLLEP